jgi:exonuclease SbcD
LVDKVVSEFPIRLVEARPDPHVEVVHLNGTSPAGSRSLTQMQPEEMFKSAFQRASGTEPTAAHLDAFHQAYTEAHE